MKNRFTRQISSENVLAFIRILCGAFFVLSGGAKFWASSSFSATLSEYGFLPEMLVVILSYGIPSLEIGLGLLLLLSFQIQKVSSLLLILVFVFTVVAFIQFQNGEISDCGCFGELVERKNNWRLFVENTVLMIFLGIIQFKSNKQL